MCTPEAAELVNRCMTKSTQFLGVAVQESNKPNERLLGIRVIFRSTVNKS